MYHKRHCGDFEALVAGQNVPGDRMAVTGIANAQDFTPDYLDAVAAYVSAFNNDECADAPYFEECMLLNRASAAIFVVSIDNTYMCYMYSVSDAGTRGGYHVAGVIEKYATVDIVGIIAEVNLANADPDAVRRNYREWLRANKMFTNLNIGALNSLLFTTSDLGICVNKLCEVVASCRK